MALFKRNPNEADYYGGKKHFIDVNEFLNDVHEDVDLRD